MISNKNHIFRESRNLWIWILSILLISFFNGCSDELNGPESGDILQRLQSLSGASVTEIEPYYGYPRAFQVDITQPVDHNNPNDQQFTQRMYLSHIDEELPMVFAPSGYAASERSGQELAEILQTNCLNVTHRYFDGAKSDPLDWQYLTIAQAAADHHRIITLLKTIYTGPWLSAGASKSGLTPLFHKRFYPDDVGATVAYVSPIMFSTSDARFINYLASIGTKEDWDRIHGFQRMLLENRNTLVDEFEAWFQKNGYIYTGDAEVDFESMVRSYDWEFWQYHAHESSEIPGADASADEILTHIDDIERLSNYSDERKGFYDPYIYQAFTEIGYPARDYSQIKDLLIYEIISPGEELAREEGIEIVYNPDTIRDIYSWIRNNGNNIILIYGSIDPWSGGAIKLIGKTNALKFMKEGEDHGVRITDLAEQDQQLILSKLEEWLGIDIEQIAQVGIKLDREARAEVLTIHK
jgi:hypothetical protein